MAKWAALAESNTAIIVAAGIFASAAIGAGFYINDQLRSGPEPLTEASAPITKPSEAERVNDTGSQDTGTAEVQSVPEDVAPSIDEVRVETDGLTIVAGKAAPGSKISILLDGVENTTVVADADGEFAAITQVVPKSVAQVLTVMQQDGDRLLASEEEIILAPTLPAVALAEATPDIATDTAEAPTASTDLSAPQVPEEVARKAPKVDNGHEPDVVEVAPPERQTVDETGDRAFAQDAGEEKTDPPVNRQTDRALVGNDALATAESAIDRADAAGASSTRAGTVAGIASEDDRLGTEAGATDAGGQDQRIAEGAVPTEAAPPSSAPQPVTVLKSTADGVEVLGRRLGPSDNVAIDTIGYSDAGDVELTGRAKPAAASIRVYVDNRSVTEVEIDAEGRWRGNLSDIATGVYTLRVDEVDASGSVLSRVETPFKREDPDLFVGTLSDARTAKQITVQTGATLWAIARERYGEGLLYVQVFEANRDSIRDPDLIYPGQVFSLPD